MKKYLFFIFNFILIQYATAQNAYNQLETKLFLCRHDSVSIILYEIHAEVKKYTIDDAKAAWKKLLDKSKQSGNVYLTIQVYLEIYHYFFSIKQYQDGLLVSGDMTDYMKSHELGKTKGEVFLKLGETCLYNHLDDKALGYYLKALDIFKKYDDKKNIYATYYGIGNSYLRANTKKSRDYMIQAIKYKNYNPNPTNYISSLNTIALTYQYEADTTNALQYFNKALETAIIYENQEWEGIISGNISAIFSKKRAYEKALTYLYKELNLVKDKENVAVTYFSIAKIYTQLNNLQKAKICLDSGLTISKGNKNVFLLKNKYDALKNYYQTTKDYKNAYEISEKLNAIDDSIARIKHIAKFEKMDIQNEFEKQEIKILHLEEKNKLQSQSLSRLQWLIVMALVSVVAMSVFLYFLYKYNQNIKKLNETLKNNHSEILEKNNQLQKQQTDLANLNAILESEIQFKQQLIESKNQELLNYALIIAENNDFLDDLKKNIADTSLKPQETRQLLQKIDVTQTKDKDWQTFKQMFDAVNPEFFKLLIAEYPDLSAQELKLCALIKLNISSKEIASILRIAPESVYKARYRIRKKMNMDSENKLNDYLFKI
ncbi:hypothetical protein AD998_12290 [bacterium 336/3]|nr:hypothetical protein AD998_12290 [bacterium 336/3]